VLFYYAGHAVQIRGENYLVPTASRATTPKDVDTQFVAMNDIFARLAKHPSRFQMVVLDACRNNPFVDPPPAAALRAAEVKTEDLEVAKTLTKGALDAVTDCVTLFFAAAQFIGGVGHIETKLLETHRQIWTAIFGDDDAAPTPRGADGSLLLQKGAVDAIVQATQRATNLSSVAFALFSIVRAWLSLQLHEANLMGEAPFGPINETMVADKATVWLNTEFRAEAATAQQVVLQCLRAVRGHVAVTAALARVRVVKE